MLYKYPLAALVCVLVVGAVSVMRPSKAFAAFPKGFISSNLPVNDNTFWENGSPETQGANLYVSHGASESPKSISSIYIPAGGSGAARVTVKGACDTETTDVINAAYSTRFYFWYTNSVVVRSGNGTLVPLQDPGAPAGSNGYAVDVNNCNDLVVDITANPNIPAWQQEHSPAGGGDVQNYYIVVFEAVAQGSPGFGDYENQFSLSTDTLGVYIGYATGDTYRNPINGTADCKTDFCTGIYNRTPNYSGSFLQNCTLSDGQCYWTTSIAFAPTCNIATGGEDKTITFYDDDATPAGNYQSVHNIKWQLLEYKRDGTGNTSGVGAGNRRLAQQGNLIGGNNTPDSITVHLDSQYSYELVLQDIYVRNSIQVALPYSQMNAFDQCTPPAPQHEAILNGPTAGSTFTPCTELSFGAGMDNIGSGEGGSTYVEFFPDATAGASYLDSVAPQPGPGLDSKLDAWSFDSNPMANGITPNTARPHYWWHRTSTPFSGEADWQVVYQPVKFKIRCNAPIGASFCVAVTVSTAPYGQANTVSSYPACYTIGSSTNGNPGGNPNPLPTSMPCPGDPTINASNDVTINLPDTRQYPANASSQPGGGGGSSTSGYGGLPGPVYQDVNQSNPYQINSANDQWGQSAVTSASIGTRSDNPFKISYQPFVSQYPYDTHSPTVNYSQYYTRYTWTASYDSLSAVYTPPVPCSINLFGYCVGGAPGYTTYSWTYSYKLNQGSQINNGSISPNQGGLVTMQACYDRTYSGVTAQPTAPLFDDEEQPSHVTFVDNLSVNMSLPANPGIKGLRQSLKVQLDVGANFYIKHANGSTSPIPQAHTTVALPTSNALFDSGSLSAPASASRSFTDVFDATIPPLTVGDEACVSLTGLEQQGTMKIDGTRTSQSGSNTATQCSLPLVNKPYFKVYGGDVNAGGAFTGGNCSQTGSVDGFYRQSVAAGASTQFAAMAIGQITEFGSAQLKPSGTPTRPLGLSFGNSGVNTSFPAMGGSFGGSHCVTDYWATKPSTASTPQAIDSYGSVAGASGVVYIKPPSGTATLSGGANITGSKTIYVEGNVVLSGDFSYNNTTGWNNQNSIPSLFIIAKGNIYVDANTSQLDGTYVAQPNNVSAPTDGYIYTCANGATPVALSSVFTGCNKLLTINGAFIASQVKLLRTNSSLRHATADEQPNGPAHSCDPSGSPSAPVCAAEIFNFSPEIYLATPSLPLIRSAYEGKYDYITTLPPLL